MKQFIIILMGLLMITSVFAAPTSDYADLSNTIDIDISLVNQDPDPAIAGDIVELRLGVENMGGQSADLNMEIKQDYPFEIIPGESSSKDIGIIGAYQDDENMQIVKYKLLVDRDAPAGTYEIDVIYWEEGSSSTIEDTVSIDIKNQESAEIIHIDRTELLPGKQESLMFTITNVGNAPLEDMTFFWQNEDDIILPVGSDNTKYVKYLDIGESQVLEYQVIADTDANGLYKLNLYLTYDDPITGEDEEISTIAGIYVGGETDFDVAFQESSDDDISFSVANIGSNPAYSVSVIIPAQDNYQVSGSSSSIIGNLDTGDYTVATFTLQGRGDTVKVQIAYTDTKGDRNIVEKDVQLTQSSGNMTAPAGMSGMSEDERAAMRAQRIGTQSTGFWDQYGGYIIVIAIVVGALVFRGWYKKQKLKNPKFKLLKK